MQIGQDGWQSSYSKVHICLQPLTFKGLLNSMLCHKPLAHKMDNKASLNISPWVTTRWEDNWEFTVWLTWAVLVAVNKCVWMSVYMSCGYCAHLNTLYVLYFHPLYLNVVLQHVSISRTFASTKSELLCLMALYIPASSCTVKDYFHAGSFQCFQGSPSFGF